MTWLSWTAHPPANKMPIVNPKNGSANLVLMSDL
jgi:hypothetical protein